MRPWLALAAILFGGSAAEARWEATEWGMTPEQVAGAMAGSAPLSQGSRGDRLGGKTIGNVGEHRFAGARFRAVYYYDAGGLAHVALYRRSGNCRDIQAALAAAYGRPVVVSDQLILRLLIWHDRPAGTRIRLLLSTSLCDLNYERLSDYEAHDLRPTG
jgi:hypothetical protein